MHVLRWFRPARAAAGAAVLVCVLAGCSSDALDVDGFSAGVCTDLAPTLQDVDESLRLLGDEDLEPGEAGDRFEAAQKVLEPVVAAGEELAEPVQELRTQLGFFRIAVDSNNYDGTQDAEVRAALEALAQECRA